MSIEARHAYRFQYLKSERWSTVRLEALARESGKCQICGEESLSNDAHHIWYPENIYETRAEHLVILCRPCHDFIHSIMPECKTSDEETGRSTWLKFSNSIIAWRRSKALLFEEEQLLKLMAEYESFGIGVNIPAKGLRDELKRLKTHIAKLEAGERPVPMSHIPNERQEIFTILTKWWQAYCTSGAKAHMDSQSDESVKDDQR